MKNLLLLGGLGALLCVSPAARGQAEGSVEKPKTAVVNIQELFKEYHKTVRTQRDINVQRARIQKEHNDMMGRLQALDEGLRKLEVRLKATDLDTKERQGLERERGLRFQERQMLDRQRRDTLLSRHGDLNQKMVVRMQSILEEIREIVAEKAEKTGFDLVFDMDGLNSTQVPFVLHVKDATDITPIIRKELNKDAPGQD